MKTQEKKDLDEAIVTGGGETGQAKTADPVGGKATLPKSNNNGESMNKIDKNGVPGQGEEQETDTANNTKVTVGGDTASKNRASVSMKEDVAAMFNGEDLSEDFKEKATVIFEAAVTAQVTAISEELEADYQAKLAEEVARIDEELSAKVDQYMNYVVEQWMEQNQVAIESSLKSEITESFINDLKSLFEQHNIAIPEEKVDLLVQAQSELEESKQKVDSLMAENMELTERVNKALRAEIFDEISEGLAATQVEKLATLSEGVTFESADGFRKKLEIVKENYFPSEKAATSQQSLLEEVSEQEETEKPAVNSVVGMYAQAISRTVKK